MYKITEKQKEFLVWLRDQDSQPGSKLKDKVWRFKLDSNRYDLYSFILSVMEERITEYSDAQKDLVNKFIAENKKEIEEEWIIQLQKNKKNL